MDVAYPFLLELYHDCDDWPAATHDFVAAVRLVEAYVFRRAICAIPTNSMNKTFATFSKALKKDRYLESIQAHFAVAAVLPPLPQRRGVHARPADPRPLQLPQPQSTGCAGWRTTAARSACRWTSTPSSTSCRRTTTSPAAWKAMLGPEWERVQQQWLHTLGNLTLTGYNAEYSDRPFAEKRDMAGGFKRKPAPAQRGARPARPLGRGRDPGAGARWPSRRSKVWAGPRSSRI